MSALNGAVSPGVVQTGSPATELGPSWLRDQLPRVMMQDPFLHGFTGIAQELGDGIRHGIDSIEHQLDVSLASPPMLTFLGRWLGVDLDPSGDPAHHRELLRSIGPLLGRRGTVRGLEDLLEALTGGRASVRDGGGVYIDADQVPGDDRRVIVRLDHLGPLTLEQVHAFLVAELPVGAEVEVQVGRTAPARPSAEGAQA